MSTPAPTGVIVVVRSRSSGRIPAVLDVLASSGLSNVEISLVTPGALETIAGLRRDRPHMIVGAGTVLTGAQAQLAADHGATFLLSPTFEPDVIEVARRNAVVAIAGALTPTEIIAAANGGADAVKIYPVTAVGGVDYVRSLKQPFPDLTLIPTGGITPGEVPDYLAAGSHAVGIGAPLVQDALDDGDLASLRQRAESLVCALRDRGIG